MTARFWRFYARDDGTAELRIDGDIVDEEDVWIYEWLGLSHTTPNAFRDELATYAGRPLTVWIDSLGGSVWAAAGIYNALMEHKGKVTVKIDGKALSAASLIAMAGDEVLMSPAGIMMIHNPWIHAVGDAAELRRVADVMDEVKEATINAYELKTGLPRDEISRLMDEETWMSARKAIELGFADGMLYAEGADEPAQARAAPAAFAISRFAIQAKADAAMRRFFDVWRAHQPREAARDALRLQLEAIKLKEVEEDEPDDA